MQAVGVSNYGPKQMRKIHTHLTARGIPLASAQVGATYSTVVVHLWG